MSGRVILSGACCLALLAGCAGDKKPVRLCPQVAIVRALERVEDHGHDAAEDTRLVGAAQMKKIEGGCTYKDEGADVNFTLTLGAEKGPALGGERISFPLFVSLVSPEDKVLGKELMTSEFVFADQAKVAQQELSLHVFIPLGKDEDASSYRVLMGFQLTEGQIKALDAKAPAP